jgi:chemotaxis protein MotB
MALSSRRQRRYGIDIWPGFVDALAQLVMVIVFVLLVFTAGQFYLTDALSGRDAALQQLNTQLSQLADMLSLERTSNGDLQARLAQLQLQLQQATEARDQNAQDLAAAREQGGALQDQLKASDAKADQAQATIDTLNEQMAALRTQLAQIAAALDTAQTQNKTQEAQIADLGQKLNTALLSKVEELARYRSEFFGRIRDALGDRSDIHIVGDRFVFQSEVLFATGDATLNDAAKQRLAVVAGALKDISSKIPPDIQWVLQVDGHTDKRPIRTAGFTSNWELSAARAISVVNFLISQGIPADHLSAAGFGEFQPVDTSDTDEAYAKNRRIELKLTER